MSWCQFVRFTSPDYDKDIFFGIWHYQWFSVLSTTNPPTVGFYTTCHSYPEAQDIDSKWKSVQAFSIIAPVFGFFSCIALCCSVSSKVPAKCGALLLFLTTLFQGLQLLVFQSNMCDKAKNTILTVVDNLTVGTWEDKCSLTWGTNCAIAATCMYFVAMLMACASPPGGDDDDEEEVADREPEKVEAGEEEEQNS